MEIKPIRKLDLKKKTVSKLAQGQMSHEGSIVVSVSSYYSIGCGSDFTRTSQISTIHQPSH